MDLNIDEDMDFYMARELQIERYRNDRIEFPENSYSYFLNGYDCEIKWCSSWNGYVKPSPESRIPKEYTGTETILKGEHLPEGVHGGFTDGYLGFDTAHTGDVLIMEHNGLMTHNLFLENNSHFWTHQEVLEHLDCITKQLREVDENPPPALIKAAEF